MSSMQLLKKYGLNILGQHIGDVTIKDEWNGFIELDGGPNKGKIIVRRKGWNNGKKWAKEENAFIEQELDILYADTRFGLPETEVMFVRPESKSEKQNAKN